MKNGRIFSSVDGRSLQWLTTRLSAYKPQTITPTTRKDIKSVDYEQSIKKIISNLKSLYDEAPEKLINKYDSLFACVVANQDRPLIKNTIFTFFPSNGRVISADKKIIVQLTKVQADIFYALAKNLFTDKAIHQEVIYHYVYGNKLDIKHSYRTDNPSTGVINVHMHYINQKIKPLNLKIRHMNGFGWSLRIEKG